MLQDLSLWYSGLVDIEDGTFSTLIGKEAHLNLQYSSSLKTLRWEAFSCDPVEDYMNNNTLLTLDLSNTRSFTCDHHICWMLKVNKHIHESQTQMQHPGLT